MLYKVYLSRLDGTYGNTPTGYVSLCYGHINIGHIYTALTNYKIVPASWFRPRELQIIESPTTFYGVKSFTLCRRQPYGTILIYLFPVCKPQNKSDNIYTTMFPAISASFLPNMWRISNIPIIPQDPH